MKTNIITAALLAALSLPASAVVNLDYVTVGNAGNAADPATGKGSVSYAYQIGKYEVTVGQYVEFLNSVASTDSYGLYNTSMEYDTNVAGIARSGSVGSYLYTTINSPNRPVAYVSWLDAARFTNWIHNGQGNGSTETGVYTLNGATSGAFAAEVGSTVWLPTMNEWYKAAYYDPSKNSGAGGYWLHANQSDTLTNNVIGVAGAVNYYAGAYATTQSPIYNSASNYLTDVGVYGADSESYYGTNDQSGNLFEWTDESDLVYDWGSGTFYEGRISIGGSWYHSENVLRSTKPWNDSFLTTYESPTTGFRLASIPEPTSGLLAVLGLFPLFARRRKA